MVLYRYTSLAKNWRSHWVPIVRVSSIPPIRMDDKIRHFGTRNARMLFMTRIIEKKYYRNRAIGLPHTGYWSKSEIRKHDTNRESRFVYHK
jgi:hypothetical protein